MKIAFILIVIHYIADFIFQAEDWAINKSKSNSALLKHTGTYTLVFFFFFANWCVYCNHISHVTASDMGWDWRVLLFFPITFVAHTITDYITSRWVSGKFKRNHLGSPIPNFGAFSSIGFDQVLHYAQLFLTYHLLTS